MKGKAFGIELEEASIIPYCGDKRMADLDNEFRPEQREQHHDREASNNLCHDAYNGFQGIDLGIVRIGQQDCSLSLGFDFGIVHANGSLGKHTGVEAGAGVPGASVDGAAGATIDERNGIRAGAGGSAELGPIAGGEAHVGAALGRHTGANAGGDVYVGPASAGGQGGAYINEHGLHARSGADLELEGVAGSKTRVRADIGDPTGVAIKHEGYLGPAYDQVKAGAYVAPHAKVYVKGSAGIESGLY